MQIRLLDQFESFSGESNFFQQGRKCSFVRLHNCNLNCAFCDTPEGEYYFANTEDLVFNSDVVCITGGEPLLQEEAVLDLLKQIRKQKKQAYIETNGSIDWTDMPCPCVVDYKLEFPDLMVNGFIKKIRAIDFMKVVVSDLSQLNFLKTLWKDFKEKTPFLSSPCFCIGMTDFSFYKDINSFCEAEGMHNVIYNFQLHKLLNVK